MSHYSIRDSLGTSIGMVYFVDSIENLEDGKLGLVRNGIGGYIAILQGVELEKV